MIDLIPVFPARIRKDKLPGYLQDEEAETILSGSHSSANCQIPMF